jgi:hypothetical protein
MPADLLAEVQSRPELDTYAARLDYVTRRVAHHRTLAQRAKPAPVDPSGDALMAAMSAPTAAIPDNSVAATLKLIQEQLNALSSWSGGDLDAIGKGKGAGRKGGGKKGGGRGCKDGSSKGPSGAINGTCWACGVYGHRQSDCPAASGHPKGGKGKGGKGGKGKGGKGLYEVAWDSHASPGNHEVRFGRIGT